MQAVKIIGVAVGNRNQFEGMLRAVAQAEIVPVIETTFPLDRIKEAMGFMKSGRHFGKIGLTFD
jgi:D-arabinose 1-dehydrogenase-like Zn-dependent alcohol dehydrogenase